MMTGNDHPFFRPLWRRLAIVAVCIVWTGFEYYGGDRFWMWIAVAFTAYAIVKYLVLYKPKDDAPATTHTPEDGE